MNRSVSRATRLGGALTILVSCVLVGGCGGSNSGVSLRAVEWSKVNYPVACPRGQQAKAEDLGYSYVDALGPIALVIVQCLAEDGTGATGLLLYDKPRSPTKPHLVRVLLSPDDGWIPGTPNVTASTPLLTALDGSVSLKVAGYKDDEARCCPSVFTTLEWSWNGRDFVETTEEPVHNR